MVGDAVYGGQKPRSKGPLAAFGRQALHAAELAFRHPRNGVEVVFRAPLPIDMEELLIRLRQLAQPAERARKGRGSAMLD